MQTYFLLFLPSERNYKVSQKFAKNEGFVSGLIFGWDVAGPQFINYNSFLKAESRPKKCKDKTADSYKCLLLCGGKFNIWKETFIIEIPTYRD